MQTGKGILLRASCGLLAVVTLLLAGGCRRRPAGEGEIWAEVNGHPIYQAQVENYYEQEVRALPEPFTPEEALARKLTILGELIQNEILWQAAVQAGVVASDAEVERRFQELRASIPEEEFERQLSDRGMTLDDLKTQLRRQLAIRNLLSQATREAVQVSEQEVRDYYQQHKQRFRFVETQYRVAHILVTPRREPEVENLQNDDAITDAQARRKTERLLERLRAGDDFGELARNYSEDPDTALGGGDLGFFPESALADTHPNLRSAVQRLGVGQFTGPVRTQRGYHLVKLLEREPPGQRELSDPQVQKTIREQLQGQKRRLLEAAYIERARNQAHVVNYLARQILESRRLSP